MWKTEGKTHGTHDLQNGGFSTSLFVAGYQVFTPNFFLPISPHEILCFHQPRWGESPPPCFEGGKKTEMLQWLDVITWICFQ
jgi:hypothetical protein